MSVFGEVATENGGKQKPIFPQVVSWSSLRTPALSGWFGCSDSGLVRNGVKLGFEAVKNLWKKKKKPSFEVGCCKKNLGFS